MIIVAISHRNRQQRRAMARALQKQVARATGAQVRAHFMALSNYLRDADPASLEALGLADHADHTLLGYVIDQAHGGEKVDLIGYRNVTAQFERAQTEMLAQIARARGADPIEHYVISWGDDEHPTPEQVDEAVALLMRVLNLEEHQAIYAAHRNTAHYHVHVAVTVRHPRVTALVRASAERVRVVPDNAMRHVAALTALCMPCLCRAGEDCMLQLPAFFLPDPDETEAGLIRVAQATWKRWAEQHAAWAEDDHSARVALRALADRTSSNVDA